MIERTLKVPYENMKPAEFSNPVTHLSHASDRAEREFEQFLHHARELMGPQPKASSLREWVDLAEAWRITQILKECDGNRSATARQLGIGRRTLYAKMEKLKISPSWNF
jgi:DNA-binding NtrC family response regulator